MLVGPIIAAAEFHRFFAVAEGDPLDAQCPAAGPWLNHGSYVSCVAQASQDMVNAGSMTHDQRQAIMTAAAQSNVGK